MDLHLPGTGLPALLPDDTGEHGCTLSAAAGSLRRLILDRRPDIDLSFVRGIAVRADITAAHARGALAGDATAESGKEVQSLDPAACQHPCEHFSERTRGSFCR